MLSPTTQGKFASQYGNLFVFNYYQMLFFSSRCERLCMVQFALISLIPGLLRRLEDCADPEFDSHEKNLAMPTSLKSSERSSRMFVS